VSAVGDALNVAAAALTTVTVVDAAADPPVPLQVRVNVLLPAVPNTVVRLPALTWVPLQAPLATQDDVLVVDHVRVTLAPAVAFADDEINVTVGAAAAGAAAAGGVVDVKVEEPPLPSEPPHALRQRTPNEATAMTSMIKMRIRLPWRNNRNNRWAIVIARNFPALQ
jgi:hypothetical protein